MRNLTNAVRHLTRRPGLPVVIVAILAKRVDPMNVLREE